MRIAANDDAHILAVGTDDAGRTQYRYNERFRLAADRLKFARLEQIGSRLARLRRTTGDALGADHDHRDVAAVIGLIDITAIRVGSERYAREHVTIGASTLQRRHVDTDDPLVRLEFTAKGGIERSLKFEQRNLARFLDNRRRKLRRSPDPLFTGPGGGRINGGVVSRVAAHLGNTRTVARSSYVAPSVIEAFEDGRLSTAWSRSRHSATYSRAEQTLRKILTD